MMIKLMKINDFCYKGTEHILSLIKQDDLLLQVKGASVSSPYRLRPLVGVRVPLNSTYSPLIYMHNPHSTPMQVRKQILFSIVSDQI